MPSRAVFKLNVWTADKPACDNKALVICKARSHEELMDKKGERVVIGRLRNRYHHFMSISHPRREQPHLFLSRQYSLYSHPKATSLHAICLSGMNYPVDFRCRANEVIRKNVPLLTEGVGDLPAGRKLDQL